MLALKRGREKVAAHQRWTKSRELKTGIHKDGLIFSLVPTTREGCGNVVDIPLVRIVYSSCVLIKDLFLDVTHYIARAFSVSLNHRGKGSTLETSGFRTFSTHIFINFYKHVQGTRDSSAHKWRNIAG